MKTWLLILALAASPAFADSYQGGFWLLDTSRLGDDSYSSWFNPGDDKHNPAAQSTWNAMTACDKARVALFHDATLKWLPDGKKGVVYTVVTPDLDVAKECNS